MAEGQARAVAHLTRVRRAYEGGLVAMITHAEIIRAVGLYEANLPLGRWREFEVAPATITRFSCTSSLLKSAEEMAA